MALAGAAHFAGQRPDVGRIVKPDIVDPPAVGAQFLREVAHGGEDEGDLLLVVRHIGRLGRDFGHQHHIARAVTCLQGGQGGVELVAKDEDDLAGHPVALAGGGAPGSLSAGEMGGSRAAGC